MLVFAVPFHSFPFCTHLTMHFSPFFGHLSCCCCWLMQTVAFRFRVEFLSVFVLCLRRWPERPELPELTAAHPHLLHLATDLKPNLFPFDTEQRQTNYQPLLLCVIMCLSLCVCSTVSELATKASLLNWTVQFSSVQLLRHSVDIQSDCLSVKMSSCLSP